PAALCFTDGRWIGGTLDRNGLRPARWLVTKDGLVVLGSETGVLDIAPERIDRKGRLQPGRMFLVDLEEKRIVDDEEIKDSISKRRPYGKWLRENKIDLDALEDVKIELPEPTEPLLVRQKTFGYTQEDVRILMAPMAASGQEAVGSMGT